MDCYKWFDSWSDSFLLTINAAVIYMFHDLWIYIINDFEYIFNGETVRSRYVFGLSLCQDKPYGTIILTMISFRTYNDNYNLWSFLSLYILTPTKLLYKHRSMFLFFGYFYIVTIIFFHEFCMLYHVWLCSCHPCNITLIIFFLSLTIQLYFCCCQVINYNWESA